MKTMITRTLAMTLFCALGLPAMGQTRIGTIDLRKVFDNYWKRQHAEAALKERGTAMDTELKRFMEDYNKTKYDYKKLIEISEDKAKNNDERDKAKAAAESKLIEIKTSENT